MGGRPLGVTLVLAAAGLAAAVGLQVVRDRLYPREEIAAQRLLYVRSPDVVRRAVLAFDALAADVYWIRALQHYGGDRLGEDRQGRYELLYPLLDLTTSLDPYFTIAYRFGAIFLSEPPPGGPGRPDRAIDLLQKGIEAQPEKWQYYHDVAFVHYWQLRDMEAAARWFRLAAAQPGAPRWLEPVAASMLIKGGDRASARFILRQLLESEEVWVRRMAARALQQVDALDTIDQLEALVARVRLPEGQPYSWDLLIRGGALRRVPVDPTGMPFQIDPDTGRVSVSDHSELFPMPSMPERS
jgi:hypothetical protein